MKYKKSFVFFIICVWMTALAGCTAAQEDSSSSLSASSMASQSLASAEGSVLQSRPESVASSQPSSEPETEPANTSSSLVPVINEDLSPYAALDSALVTWGPGAHFDENNHPTDLDVLQEKYNQYNCWFYGKEKGKIYLTFDEGYENGNTAEILDVLKEKDVKAVFFVTGHYVESQPELVARMIDEGHVVGNHSDKHPNNGGYTTYTLQQVQEDILSLHNLVKERFDYTMSVFRYPEGAFSEQTAALIGEMGYRQLFWSFAYNDWDVNNQPTKEQAYQKIVDRAHDGAIYLLHAVSTANTAALPDAIDALRAQGYEFALFHETVQSPAADSPQQAEQ